MVYFTRLWNMAWEDNTPSGAYMHWHRLYLKYNASKYFEILFKNYMSACFFFSKDNMVEMWLERGWHVHQFRTPRMGPSWNGNPAVPIANRVGRNLIAIILMFCDLAQARAGTRPVHMHRNLVTRVNLQLIEATPRTHRSRKDILWTKIPNQNICLLSVLFP